MELLAGLFAAGAMFATLHGLYDLLAFRRRLSRNNPIDTKPSAPVVVKNGNRKD